VNLLKLGSTLHCEHFAALKNNPTLRLKGIFGDHVCRLHIVTDDPAAVIGQSEIILIYYVANYHEMIATRIAPYLRPQQLVYTCPGYLGSLLIRKHRTQFGSPDAIVFTEGETLPFTSRITAPGEVTITSKNVRHPIAVLPTAARDRARNLLAPVLGQVELRDSLIEVALHNPNLVIHTTGLLLNMSRVEDPARNFAMYRDGFTPSIWKLVEKLDAEKMAVLAALGHKPRTYFEEFLVRTFEDYSAINPLDGFRHYAGESPDGPFTVNNRYVTEDVPMGLGLLSSLGRHLNLATPVTNMLIQLAAVALGRDFVKESRTIESLGFASLPALWKALQ
jgi:opine dehydrogenase